MVPISIYSALFALSRNVLINWLAIGLVVAHFGLQMLQRWREQKDKTKEDAAFSRQHGCLPNPTVLPQTLTWGIDILKKQWDAMLQNHLLMAQSPFLKEMPNMKTHILGGVGYLTTDPKNIESMLYTNFQDWHMGSRNGGLYPLLGEGIFTQDGARWKHSREILRKQFARINVRDLSNFDTHVEQLVHSLRASKGVVDLQEAFFKFTLGTTTSLIFGKITNDKAADERAKFGRTFDYAQRVTAVRLRLADLHWLYMPTRFRKACNDCHAYAAYFVDQALAYVGQGEKELESKSLIRDLYRELGDQRLVRDQLMHVLVAGRDTTACTMSWAMYLLVRHPKTLERLRTEIKSVVQEGEKLTRAHLIKLPYLACVLNKTMRLYPQLPVNARISLNRTVLPRGGGPNGTAPIFIPKNTGVVYSVYHMHRREDLYGPDANGFRPGRWGGHGLEGQVGWGFMPFHGGPRLCLGKDFALTEASYGIVDLLRAFPGIRLPPGEGLEPIGSEEQILGLTVASFHGCKVLLS